MRAMAMMFLAFWAMGAARGTMPATLPATMPATLPATMPALSDWQPFKAALAALQTAKAGVPAAESAARSAFLNSQAYRDGMARLKAAQAEYDALVGSGTPQQRLAAATKRTNAKLALDAAQTSAVASDPGVARARTALGEAERLCENRKMEHERARAMAIAAIEAEEAKDPIKVAIKQKQVIVGMTLAQADAAMERPGQCTYEDEDGTKQYSWPIYTTHEVIRPTGGTRTVRRQTGTIAATVRGGKVVSVTRY